MSTLEVSLLRVGNKSSNLTEKLETPLRVLADGEQAPEGCGQFSIMSKNGDDRVVWDSKSLADIQAANQLYLDLVVKGLKPYRVGPDGRPTGEVMKKFDGRAEEVVFVPFGAVGAG